MNPNLAKFHNSLAKASNINEINSLLKAILKTYEITMFTYTFYSLSPRSQEIKYDTCSSNYLAWHQHYLAEEYNLIDKTHNLVSRNSLPVFWNLQDQIKNAKTQKEKQMRLDSIKYGVIKGVSIPLQSSYKDYANFLVAQNKNEHCLDNWEQIQYDLFIIAHLYHQYIQNFILKNLSPLKECALSKREMQCLTLTAKKYSVEEIAQKLNITERTVNFHLQNINKKFSTRNKHQSVAFAVENKILVL